MHVSDGHGNEIWTMRTTVWIATRTIDLQGMCIVSSWEDLMAMVRTERD
jgi:hypothetical protein